VPESISDFLNTFLRGTWLSIVDIVVVAILIYWLFVLIRGTRAVRILIGLSIVALVYLAARALDLVLLSPCSGLGRWSACSRSWSWASPAAARTRADRPKMGSLNRLLRLARVSAADTVAREVSRAARLLAGSRHGALIVIERETGLHDLTAESGVPINADLHAELLSTIFYHGTALHDGAVVISGNKIVAAGVLLPLSQNVLDSERYGTRHRAAIGISEQTDALIVVVSEETGSISLVVRGRIERNLSEDRLRRRIFSLIRPQAPRQAAPLLRRTLEGRWGMPEVEPPDAPIDPEDRVVPTVVAPEPAETAETAEVVVASDAAPAGQSGQSGQAGPAVASGERRG
jgi:diadenylate cyclase